MATLRNPWDLQSSEDPYGGGWTSGPEMPRQPDPAQPPAAPGPTFNYEAARDDWMGGGYGQTEAGIGEWAKKHGVEYGGSGDAINLPNGGGWIDLLGNFKSGRNLATNWTAAGGNGPNGNGGGGGAVPLGGSPFGGGGQSSQYPMMGNEVFEQLKGLFPNGAFNKDVVNRRTENAREDLERYRKSRGSNTQAQLAERGLIGSGPEASAIMNLEGDIADKYINAASDIYADESANADQRMMQGLSLAAGMTMEEARNIIDMFRANTERDLGHGNLALGNRRADQDYTLGRGQYDLGRARLDYDREALDIDQLIRILQERNRGAQTGAGGYV